MQFSMLGISEVNINFEQYLVPFKSERLLQQCVLNSTQSYDNKKSNSAEYIWRCSHLCYNKNLQTSLGACSASDSLTVTNVISPGQGLHLVQQTHPLFSAA